MTEQSKNGGVAAQPAPSRAAHRGGFVNRGGYLGAITSIKHPKAPEFISAQTSLPVRAADSNGAKKNAG